MNGAKKDCWQRSDGLFIAQLVVRTPDGSKKRKSFSGRTEAEVLAKKRAVQAEQARGRGTSARRAPTLNEFADQWLNQKKVADVRDGYFSETTLEQYRDAFRRHISPSLGHLRLDELTPPVLRLWMDRKATDLSAATGKPLAPRSRKQLHAILRAALNDAKRDELIHDNQMERVRAPRVPRYSVNTLSSSQVVAFLSQAGQTRLYALWLLLLTLGLRVNEALALRWEDVDLEAGRVEVRRSLARVQRTDPATGKSRETLIVKRTKVPDTETTLVMPPFLIEALVAHRATQNRERLQSAAWHDSGLIFTTAVGTALDNRNLLDVGKKLFTAAGLEGKFTVHTLRHTAGTGLLAEGLGLPAIQKLLRHSRGSTTTDLYLHFSQELQQVAADAMEVRFRRLMP